MLTAERTYPQPEPKNRELSDQDAWLREALNDLGDLPDRPDLAHQPTVAHNATRNAAMEAKLAAFPRNPNDELNTQITSDLIDFRRSKGGPEASIAARDALRMDGHLIPEPVTGQPSPANADAPFTVQHMNELNQMLGPSETAAHKPRGVRALLGKLGLSGANHQYSGRHRRSTPQHRQ